MMIGPYLKRFYSGLLFMKFSYSSYSHWVAHELDRQKVFAREFESMLSQARSIRRGCEAPERRSLRD